MEQAEIGIIGGSGQYQMPGLAKVNVVRIGTPFGKPSDAFMVGVLEGRRVAFLARHGRGHVLTPSEMNFRANIYGMKKLGVERIISVAACGSLKEELRARPPFRPGEFLCTGKSAVPETSGPSPTIHAARSAGFGDHDFV